MLFLSMVHAVPKHWWLLTAVAESISLLFCFIHVGLLSHLIMYEMVENIFSVSANHHEVLYPNYDWLHQCYFIIQLLLNDKPWCQNDQCLFWLAVVLSTWIVWLVGYTLPDNLRWLLYFVSLFPVGWLLQGAGRKFCFV